MGTFDRNDTLDHEPRPLPVLTFPRIYTYAYKLCALCILNSVGGTAVPAGGSPVGWVPAGPAASEGEGCAHNALVGHRVDGPIGGTLAIGEHSRFVSFDLTGSNGRRTIYSSLLFR